MEGIKAGSKGRSQLGAESSLNSLNLTREFELDELSTRLKRNCLRTVLFVSLIPGGPKLA